MENLNNNAAVLLHREKEYSIQELSQHYKRIKGSEQKILRARQDGFSISQLEVEELTEKLGNALINISVITGHSLPQNKLHTDLLVDELTVYLFEYGYENLTIAEIIEAFRLNCSCNFRYADGDYAQQTAIFGEHISVDYVSKVLNTYFTFRKILDSNLKNIIDGY